MTADMIQLVTHSTQGYLPRMRPYLESLYAHWPRPFWLLTVECDAPDEYQEISDLTCVRVPKVAGSPEGTDSLQHGAFIEFVPGEGDDVLVYTDGDIVMQRAATLAELDLLDVPDDTVAACTNSSPDETLAIEGARLWPRSDPALAFGAGISRTPCFNIGIIGARRSTWLALWARYMTRWDDALRVFGAQQRQQWLVCWAIADLGLSVRRLPHSFVLNGHYPLPAGAANGPDGATYHGEPVLFRHKL